MGKYLSINTQPKIQMLDLLSVMRCLGFWASFWATFITHTQFYAETIELSLSLSLSRSTAKARLVTLYLFLFMRIDFELSVCKDINSCNSYEHISKWISKLVTLTAVLSVASRALLLFLHTCMYAYVL